MIQGLCDCYHFMIHLGSLTKTQDEINFSNETINSLIQWQLELIDSRRISSNKEFQLVGNCCSV